MSTINDDMLIEIGKLEKAHAERMRAAFDRWKKRYTILIEDLYRQVSNPDRLKAFIRICYYDAYSDGAVDIATTLAKERIEARLKESLLSPNGECTVSNNDVSARFNALKKAYFEDRDACFDEWLQGTIVYVSPMTDSERDSLIKFIRYGFNCGYDYGSINAASKIGAANRKNSSRLPQTH